MGVGLTINGYEFEPLQYGDFFDFSRWRPPPSWIFILILTVGTVKSGEPRHYAKF